MPVFEQPVAVNTIKWQTHRTQRGLKYGWDPLRVWTPAHPPFLHLLAIVNSHYVGQKFAIPSKYKISSLHVSNK